MILTSAAFLLLLWSIFRSLRNNFFILHAALVLAVSWWIEHKVPEIEFLSSRALTLFIVLHLCFINLTTVLIYFHDKQSAIKGRWRIPERSLLTFALIGGTPSAYLAQKLLKHKTRKTSFKAYFWLILAFQIILLIFLYSKI